MGGNAVAYDFMPLGVISLIAQIIVFILVIISLINIIRFTHYGIIFFKLRLDKNEKL